MKGSNAEPKIPFVYEIRLRGPLPDRWEDWFGGMTAAQDEEGHTRLVGEVVDQAALHGLLDKVRDLGLVLLSVQQRPDASSGG